MINNDFDLSGKTYLVTGASSGIGLEICKTINAMNGSFIAVARREDNLIALLEECNNAANSYVKADLSERADLDLIIGAIGKIDGIVHSAGVAKFVPLKFYSLDDFRESQKLNVESIMYLLNAISKQKKLNKKSSIVLVSSLGAMLGTKGGGYYGAVKAELMALSKVWANELSLSGTRVNCVAPGIVETDMVVEAYERLSDEEVVADKKKYPLGYGAPKDVAYPVAFLLSNASRWITGQTLILDGGRSIYV